MTDIKDTPLEVRLREHGIRHPIFTVNAAHETGCDLASLCAILMLETGGGHNEFGHDWDFEYAGKQVTEQRYEVLRQAIRDGHPSTGVGLVQLTSVDLLDKADALGGAWLEPNQLRVGAEFLKQLQDAYGVQGGFVHYNGAGPAAEEYGRRAMEYKAEFDAIIAG